MSPDKWTKKTIAIMHQMAVRRVQQSNLVRGRHGHVWNRDLCCVHCGLSQRAYLASERASPHHRCPALVDLVLAPKEAQ